MRTFCRNRWTGRFGGVGCLLREETVDTDAHWREESHAGGRQRAAVPTAAGAVGRAESKLAARGDGETSGVRRAPPLWQSADILRVGSCARRSA